jgi:DNA-binding LytR/AlgR family response regulator
MNCLIIDDDPLICDLIKHFCSKHAWIESCLAVGDGSQALQAIHTSHFDFIFLDFNLPDLNGRSLLEILPQSIPVIMVTSESGFGAESYGYPQVIDFLVKPVSYDRFVKALQKIQTKNELPAVNETNRLVVKVGNDSVILKVEDIIYMKGEGNYVKFYLGTEKILGLTTLKSLALKLPNYFARVHKSYIVNLKMLKAISGDELKFEIGAVPLGASYKSELAKRIENWQ